jgi:hypothetical protein
METKCINDRPADAKTFNQQNRPVPGGAGNRDVCMFACGNTKNIVVRGIQRTS